MTGQKTPARRAVVIACDRAYLGFSLFVFWQIAPWIDRAQGIDFILVSEEDLEIPEALAGLNITQFRLGADPRLSVFPTHLRSAASYLRLMLAERLEGRYDRLLYLDSDVFFEGGDLSVLFSLDLQGAPLAAVRDVGFMHNARFIPDEFARAGIGRRPYFNSGVLVIDPAEFVAQDVLGKAINAAKTHPGAFTLQDQSALNLALKGDFAEISPVWNWMLNGRLRHIPAQYPVRFRHFVSAAKPWKPAGFRHDYRYLQAYRGFFERFLPGEIGTLAQRTPGDFGVGDFGSAVLFEARFFKTITALMARFPQESTVIRNLIA